MGQEVQLQAEKRENVGKKAVVNLRNQGLVPASIQEHGKESISLTIDNGLLLKAYQKVGTSQALDLVIGNTKKLALIKEINFIPLKPEVQHVVFQALKADEPVDAEVPIHIVGEVPAEANRLVLLHTLETLEVRALPKNLPESLEVSSEKLVAVDDKIVVSDIRLPEGVELVEVLTSVDDEERRNEFLSQPIAIVKEPSVVESDEGAEVEEGSEGEASESEDYQSSSAESES